MILVSRPAELQRRVNEIVSFGSRQPSLSLATANSFFQIYFAIYRAKCEIEM